MKTYYLVLNKGADDLLYLQIVEDSGTLPIIMEITDALSYEEALSKFAFKIDYKDNMYIMGFNGRKVYYI